MKEKIRQALARGYCSKRNENKVLDPDLIEDMASEVLFMIKKELPDERVRETPNLTFNTPREILIGRWAFTTGWNAAIREMERMLE